MALDPVLGSIAGAFTPEAGGMPSHMAQAGDFNKALDLATPAPSQPAASNPARTQMLQPSRTDSLGHQVLDTLERFGSRAQELQRLGSEGLHKPAAVPSGPAALLNPARDATRPLAEGAKPDPKGQAPGDAISQFDDPGGQYESVFRDSMARQAKLFGLVIEVDLGKNVASTFTSTAKTLLTQSG